ncbi:MAG: cofactor-independent phosphoglycerate mutase, partial [Dethiobacteria bacterium]
MKYIVILGDGMGDYPLKQFDFKTPLQFAHKPTIDYMAEHGVMGIVQTVPAGMPPGSDTANLSVMGYDPVEHYSGRSPYEAASMGIGMGEKDISFRCNLVTLSDDEPYANKNMVDYSADEVTTDEAKVLIAELNRKFTIEGIRFYSGKSYRHLIIWKEGPCEWELTPPHDIIGKTISAYLPQGEGKEIITDMMVKSYKILMNHNINRKRIKRGLKPANSIWIWGEGRRPLIPDFKTKYGLTGAVISAVDLIKGLGICAGMESIDVPGATGNLHTDYAGKVKAALKALEGGKDFVFLHIEAPDECSHRNEPENKVKAIELIDKLVVKELKDSLDKKNMDYKILLLPDHYTPLSLRTHTADPVAFWIYSRGDDISYAGKTYSEKSAAESALHLPGGHKLMDLFLGFPGSNYTGSDEYYIHHKVMPGESISSIAQVYS